MKRMLRVLERKRGKGDHGFTLIELLVVITIPGILAAVTVFSVAGIGDKGEGAARSTDATILRTAEEAYCARVGTYGTLEDLRTPPTSLATDPEYHGVVRYDTPGTGCGGTKFVLGPTDVFEGDDADPLFYVASNNTPGWSFLAPEFMDEFDGVNFEFGASGNLRHAANAPGNTAAMLASADYTNMRNVVSTTAIIAGTPDAGLCSAAAPGPPAGSGLPANTPNNGCRGIAASAVHYTTGQLAVFSCKENSYNLPPADGGQRRCAQPTTAGDFIDQIPAVATTLGGGKTHPVTAADVVALLNANPTWKVAIATPGTTAPYGNAAQQALEATGTGGGNSAATLGAWAGITQTAVGGTPCAATGAGGPDNDKQICFKGNVTQTQTALINGDVDMAFIPLSFVTSPAHDDTNNWAPVDAALHNPIEQWAVVLETDATPGISSAAEERAEDWLSFITSAKGQAVLEEFGYLPI